MSLLHIHSLGICTSTWPSIGQLRKAIALGQGHGETGSGDEVARQKKPGDAAMVESMDAVSRWAIGAITEAWQGASLDQGIVPTDRIALLLYSAWGQVDSTVTYLESMWGDGGRFASPRHFTRSVHSSPTSLAAIHFGIHGPCQTLVHDAWPVCSVLEQADDLLNADRADTVIVCWADQPSAVATELCRRAAEDLHRAQFARFAGGDSHGGAVAAVVSINAILPGAEFGVEVGPVAANKKSVGAGAVVEQGAYPTDGALHWAAAGVAWSLAAAKAEGKALPAAADYWRESGHHGQMREVRFCRVAARE